MSKKPDDKGATGKKRAIDIVHASLARRYRAEKRFRRLGMSAIVCSMLFLSILFISIIGNGYSAFFQTYVKVDVFFDPEVLQQDALNAADYQGLIKKSLRTMFPEVKKRSDKKSLYRLASPDAEYQLRDMVLARKYCKLEKRM